MTKKRITISKKRNPYNKKMGYQVNVGGRPQMIGRGKANWWPTKEQAKKWVIRIKKEK